MAYVKMVTDSAADIPRALREELDAAQRPADPHPCPAQSLCL